MKIAKQFRWEGAHRLPNHKGNCKNLHGHSYSMIIEIEGTPNTEGILVDFADIKRIVSPLIDAWDHSTLVAKDDENLLKMLQSLESKHFILPYNSTSENLCLYVVDYIIKEALPFLIENRITSIQVLVRETETCYAELKHYITDISHPIHESNLVNVND